MDRQEFLRRLACAPAIVRASSLMPLWVPPKRIWSPLTQLPDDVRDAWSMALYQATRNTPPSLSGVGVSERAREIVTIAAVYHDATRREWLSRLQLPPGHLVIGFDESRTDDTVTIVGRAQWKAPIKP